MTVAVTTERPVAGGAMLGRESGGRVVLAHGALPDEHVVVDLRVDTARSGEGEVVRVLRGSPDRVDPPCPHVADGCGGCDWQHGRVGAQVGWKRAIVVDALRRIGHLPGADVRVGPSAPPVGYRTTLRLAVDGDGRAGFHPRRSRHVVPVPACHVAHPNLVELLSVDWQGAREVTLRTGVATGERLAVVDGRAPSVLPDDVVAVTRAELRDGRRVWFHEDVAGLRLRVSADSFFQSGPAAAGLLVEEVRAAAGPVAPGSRVTDLYGGIGLFAATVGSGGDVTLVERNRSAVADARVNLGDEARVVPVDARRYRAGPADLVIADPPRSGLGRDAARVVAAAGAPVVVLVSCDPASLARDAALLIGHGYRHAGTTVVDAFPQTARVEAVTRFER